MNLYDYDTRYYMCLSFIGLVVVTLIIFNIVINIIFKYYIINTFRKCDNKFYEYVRQYYILPFIFVELNLLKILEIECWIDKIDYIQYLLEKNYVYRNTQFMLYLLNHEKYDKIKMLANIDGSKNLFNYNELCINKSFK